MSKLAKQTPDVVTSGITAKLFRDAMAHFAGAVNIITTDGQGGRAGFTATAVCSVTDMPPTLLVCVNDKSSVGFAFRQNKAICVNTVGPEHERLAIVFGGKTPNEERFAAANWKLGKSGAPMLESSLISFDCQIVQSSVVGTHRVLVCEVLDIAKGDQSMASVYFARQFHSIPI